MTTFLLLLPSCSITAVATRNNIAVSKPLFLAIIITNAISVTSSLLLPRVQGLAFFAYIQLGFDTLFTTGVILLTGGLYSPFVFLYHLAILNAAVLLRRHGALAAATFAALCYGGTVDLLYYSVFPPSGFSPVLYFVDFTPPGFSFTVQLMVTLSSFYAIAGLGSHLTQRVSSIEQLLTERGITTQRLSSCTKEQCKVLKAVLCSPTTPAR
jgi:two-component system sensor histidine kinase PilS (NtrC family)